MTTDNPLPTPPSASASATSTPASAATTTAAASASQTTDPAAAAAAAPAAPSVAGQPAPTAQQQQQQQQQQPPSPAEAIETLLQQIVASNNEAALATTLLNSLGTSETRESVLASVTPAGADPLDALDAAQHTIGVLFILCVVVSLLLSSHPLPLRPVLHRFYIRIRVRAEQRCAFFVDCLVLFVVTYRSFVCCWVFSASSAPPRSARLTSTTTTAPAVPFAYIQNFCQVFNPEAARLAPERGKSLALRVLHTVVLLRVLMSAVVYFAPSDHACKGNCAARRGSGPCASFFPYSRSFRIVYMDRARACFVSR